MMVLLDSDERALQEAVLFGPPLGPDGAPPAAAAGVQPRALRFVDVPPPALGGQPRPDARYNAAYAVLHTHVQVLLAAAGAPATSTQADALLALLDADRDPPIVDRDRTLDGLGGDSWKASPASCAGSERSLGLRGPRPVPAPSNCAATPNSWACRSSSAVVAIHRAAQGGDVCLS